MHTLKSTDGSLAERKGLVGGVGSPGEMTTSWASCGEVSISSPEETPGSPEKIIREPFGSPITSASC